MLTNLVNNGSASEAFIAVYKKSLSHSDQSLALLSKYYSQKGLYSGAIYFCNAYTSVWKHNNCGLHQCTKGHLLSWFCCNVPLNAGHLHLFQGTDS